MNQEFDYFLLLSALALVLVIWLLIKLLKQKKPQASERKIIQEKPRARVERISTRKRDEAVKIQTPKVEKMPRAMLFYFTTKEGRPFASLQLCSVGAQPWGDKAVLLSDRLQRFCDRFLKKEDHESLLIHLYGSDTSETELLAQAFSEKGESFNEAKPVGLKVSDFPVICENTREELKAWTLGFLFQNYRKAFYKLAPSEEAQLIKLEYCPETVIEKADFSPLALKAEAYLILSRILSEPDFHKRSVIWNQYWSIIESKGFTYTETLESCERLVISQTFVQTQKLPFLLIQTPTSCGKCYNALNY